MGADHNRIMAEDSLPIRRRQAGEGEEIIRHGVDDQAIGSGTTFAHPDQEFPRWKEIEAAVKAEFVARSRDPGGASSIREEEAFYMLVNGIVAQNFPEVRPVDIPRLVELLRAYLFGYGALEDYMAIPGLEELYFNRYDEGFYIAGGQKSKITDQIFSGADDMIAFLNRVANENGLEINLQKPILDAALNDGSRLNASIEPIAVDGADFIIRKHRNIPFTLEDIVSSGMVTPELVDDLRGWVQGGCNLVVSGGTASGKTSLLNTIGKSFIPPSDRVLVLENRKELQIQTEDCKYFQTREDPTRPGSGDSDITLDVLIRATLRKRPKRIIVGEVRGSEAYDALEAWNTGHEGSLCTIHANSAPEAVTRLESLASRSGQLDPVGVRRLIASSVDVILQINLDDASGRRAVVEVVQVIHPFKFAYSDKVAKQRWDALIKKGALRQMRDELYVLPLYEWVSGKLQKVESFFPIAGRGPRS